jgi:EAL domain-containing protein (putative c-di-GMP-specific phosphodiesterase class I)/CHASE2 domain-containing sensor protein
LRAGILFWPAIVGLIFGAIEFGEPIEESLQIARNKIRSHPASGEVVILAIDDQSTAQLGAWPWPRRHYAEILERLQSTGARRVFFEQDFSVRSQPADDAAFAHSLRAAAMPVVLSVHFSIDPATGRRTDSLPIPEFRARARLANINFRYDRNGVIWNLPSSMALQGRPYPSLAASIANVQGRPGQMFPIDYSIDAGTVPTVSAADLMRGAVPAERLAGKDVIVGGTSLDEGSVYFIPGRGRMTSVYVHALGAETLKAGHPFSAGWLLPFIAALLLSASAMRRARHRWAAATFAAGFIGLVGAPLLLDHLGLYVHVVPAMFLLIVVTARWAWATVRQSYRARSITNEASGLPNLVALREESEPERSILIAARIRNYPEISSALVEQEERELLHQITSRLILGTPEAKLYQGDEGIFVWLWPRDREGEICDHLDALHALFRSPVAVAQSHIDLVVTFGVETSSRPISNRLGSALVAADEAAADGEAWKNHDPARLEDATWKLSLLSQLDAAIDAGDLWVAYQPKLDIAGGRIVGAEALVRWSHPDKGPISPAEFIPAAEQSDRIGKLTLFVLRRAIEAAGMINARGIEFEVSVNLSARLIGSEETIVAVEELLNRFGLPPHLLTLEVTETAALMTGHSSMDMLHRLRELGVQVSIDDYGTGLSTLDYLKRIPATEIKIDKSFVQAIHTSHSDKLMVHSTIQLAHALGQRVVAEGVETQQTLEALGYMNCDLAQGYYIDKPMPLLALSRKLLKERRRLAA